MDTPASSSVVGAIVRRLLVVAMAMERLAVCRGRASRQSDGLHVVDLHKIVEREQQATGRAPSALAGKEPPEGRSCLWVHLASLSPVGEVAIERGGRAAHLNMTTDRRVGVVAQPHAAGRGEVPRPAGASAPVAADNPAAPLRWMPSEGPAPELLVKVEIAGRIGGPRHHRPVVGRPAPDFGVQQPDQLLLTRRAVVTDHRPQVRRVSLDGLFAGGHARGEAERLSARRASGARVAHRKLTDRAAQEVEAHLALMLVQGVGDPRLAWLELQSYLCQPGAQRALGRFHTLHVRVEDDQVE